MEDFFDRFAERARAKGERLEGFTFDAKEVDCKGDCIIEAINYLDDLIGALEGARETEDDTTKAMIDEAAESIAKFVWMLKSMQVSG